MIALFLLAWLICGLLSIKVFYKRTAFGRRQEFIDIPWCLFIVFGGMITLLIAFLDSDIKIVPKFVLKKVKNPWRKDD